MILNQIKMIKRYSISDSRLWDLDIGYFLDITRTYDGVETSVRDFKTHSTPFSL